MKGGHLLHGKIISIILVMCLFSTTLCGCSLSSKHLEVTYSDNDNGSITDWDDAQEDNVTDWDSDTVTTWEDVDDYSDWVYSELLFDDVCVDYPAIECQVLDYNSNGEYFDGEKVYSLINNKFDANSFVAQYAIGTGVIVICVVLNVATAGATTPVACIMAGAADGAIKQAIKGAAFGATIKAVTTAIKTNGDLEDTIYGSLEGSAEGYMVGAIYGAITGGWNSKFCFEGDTLVKAIDGEKPIQEIRQGDQVMAYSELIGQYEYERVTQVNTNETTEIIQIKAGNDIIRSTPNHPYWNGKEWVPADDIKVGDQIQTYSDGLVLVDEKELFVLNSSEKTYNLSIEKDHSFLVGRSGIVVHNRCKPNEDYANKTFTFDDNPDLKKKYPNGVKFTADGYPDFSPYADKTITFDPPSTEAAKAGTCLTGDNYHDFKMANKAIGLKGADPPDGFTWHHKEDMRTLELIPTDLHQAVRHAGGASLLRQLFAAAL